MQKINIKIFIYIYEKNKYAKYALILEKNIVI